MTPILLLLALFASGENWKLEDLKRFLTVDGQGLTEKDWETVDKGGVAAKTLPPSNPREVVVLGAIWVPRAAAGCFVQQLEDIEKFKTGPLVQRVHKISDPPTPANFQTLQLTPDEIESLEACRPGKCRLKLPANAIGTTRTEQDLRAWLFDYLQTYRKLGNPALVQYDSAPVVARLSVDLAQILDAKPSIRDLSGEAFRYLSQYPKSPPADSILREFLYWSTENFGLKPVTSLTHVHIFQQTRAAIAASKQIYANHYMDASLGLSFAVDAPEEDGMYLVYLNRTRIDLLQGWLGGIRKIFLRRRLLNGFRDNLREAATRLEETCHTMQPLALRSSNDRLFLGLYESLSLYRTVNTCVSIRMGSRSCNDLGRSTGFFRLRHSRSESGGYRALVWHFPRGHDQRSRLLHYTRARRR